MATTVARDAANRRANDRRASAAFKLRLALPGSLGPVLNAKLQSLRVHAAAYLHGHSVGGTNPSLLEALACGSLVIAHDNPFNREVARDAAEYFETPQQLARQLEQMVQLPLLERSRRCARAREIVAKNYTWDRIADDYEALLFAQCRPHCGVVQPGVR